MSKKQVGRSLLCILSKTEQISTELTFTLQGRRFTGGSSCAGPSRSFRAAEILNRQSNCLPDNARFGKWLQKSMGTAAGPLLRPGERKSSKSTSQRSPGQQAMYLLALVISMVGLTYASVPLYRMFCQATGYGGTVQQGSTVEEKLQKRLREQDISLESAAAARNLTVTFNADVSDGMNWKFIPTQRSVKINPGQSTLAFYTAHNLSDKAITGVSTYNVSPQQAGAYFNKIQCFCFEEQKLRPGEKIDMPVFFYVDPEFATDPKMKGISTLTLSYTFFKVDEEDAAVEDST